MAQDYWIFNYNFTRQPQDRVPASDDKATKLSNIIQELIDNGLIAALEFKTVNILTENDTTVKARYAGTIPTAEISGDNDETVTINVPEGCIPLWFIVQGLPANTDDDSRTFIFQGANLPGNTSFANIVIPGIIKAGLTTSFGALSEDNPWAIDFGSPGDADIIGVGTSLSPSLSLKINNLNTLTDYHLIKFQW